VLKAAAGGQQRGVEAAAGGCLVAVVGRLVRAGDGQAEVRGLLARKRRELDAELGEVRARDLLVELLRQHVHAERELLRRRPERNLREHLVRERARHHERRVARRAAGGTLARASTAEGSGVPEVDEAALSQKDDVAARRHREAVDLGLDVDDRLRVGLEPGDINLDVEVTNATAMARQSPDMACGS
jgi:hypothetical protein